MSSKFEKRLKKRFDASQKKKQENQDAFGHYLENLDIKRSKLDLKKVFEQFHEGKIDKAEQTLACLEHTLKNKRNLDKVTRRYHEEMLAKYKQELEDYKRRVE
jgi:DNA mismatch repair ATPase MutS